MKLALTMCALAAVATAAVADDRHNITRYATNLETYQEVPALSTPASGRFRAVLNERDQTIEYELSYTGLSSAVAQAHIHFGQRGVNGGIMVFLCTNAGNGPAGTQACPGPTQGSISGTLAPADVIGPAGQGIAAGEFAELVAALRRGVAYANVHTANFPAGEIRGQVHEVRRH